MGEAPDRVWQLRIGPHDLGTLSYTAYETPWFYADFAPTSAFERFRRYFTDPERWADSLDPELDAICAEVQRLGGVRLVDSVTGTASVPLIHFSEDWGCAWLRR